MLGSQQKLLYYLFFARKKTILLRYITKNSRNFKFVVVVVLTIRECCWFPRSHVSLSLKQ